LRYDVAEGIVGDLVEHRAGLVQHQPNGVRMVGQIPLHPLTGVRGSEIHPRERLVEPVAVQIAGEQLVGAVQFGVYEGSWPFWLGVFPKLQEINVFENPLGRRW